MKKSFVARCAFCLTAVFCFCTAAARASGPVPKGRWVIRMPPFRIIGDAVSGAPWLDAPDAYWSLSPVTFSSKDSCRESIQAMDERETREWISEPTPIRRAFMVAFQYADCARSDGTARFILGLRAVTGSLEHPTVHILREGWDAEADER